MALTFKEAVYILRNDTLTSQGMVDSYLSGPVADMTQRFAGSEEFIATKALAKHYAPDAASVVDIGAGSGFASGAWALAGYRTTAVEPSDCDEFGNKACAQIPTITTLPGSIYDLPLSNDSADMAYSRQVLHHLSELQHAAKEVARILRPSGVWLAVREHVVSDEQQLQEFLSGHPIHSLCENECAYTLPCYLSGLSKSFRVEAVLKPFDSVINHFPIPNSAVTEWLTKGISRYMPSTLAERLARVPVVEKLYRHRLSTRCRMPGRMYSFVLRKL